MQIFKQKKYLTFSASFILFSGISFISAQSMPKMPEMPAFPEITTPSTDSGFYKPSIPNYPKKPSSPSVTEQTKSTQQEQILTDSKKTSDLLNLFNSTDMLTASDISSLSSSGLFSNLSSLYGNSSSLNESSNQVLLEQILESLNDLKKIQNENTSSKTSSLESAFKDREPSILRFKINGYDIKDSLTTVYFSKPEADGSFLLTADRRYISGNKMLNETFYFLFKSKEGLGTSINYEVEPSIIQDEKNENSFLYKLTKLKNLTAKKTGNLVVFRSEGKDFSSDMLLDVDN